MNHTFHILKKDNSITVQEYPCNLNVSAMDILNENNAEMVLRADSAEELQYNENMIFRLQKQKYCN